MQIQRKRTSGATSTKVPEEVRREFEDGLDSYVEDWTSAVKDHVESLPKK
jgi:hypothetical protein